MPDIAFYNALTHRTEPFTPAEPGRVTMYNCGPTVYDFAHIGNFKTFLFADVLRRFLELTGLHVDQVMNLTDVGHMTEDQRPDGGGEDKMAVAGQRLQRAKKAGDAHAAAIADPDDPYQVAAFYIDAFVADARALGLKVADEVGRGRMPRATAFVPQMVAMIERLVDRGHAYVGDDGAVYYDVQSFPDYGRLSGNRLDQLKGGAGGRVVAANTANKRHPADFLLWKPDATHLMKWDSPWGAGYPGWHIECSAMARAVLERDVIDIHTGGEDNIFPHHECEIAQSCGASGKDRFARFWMHSRHLMVEGEKMSKSRGNFFTVRQVLGGAVTGRRVDPAVLRYELIKASYRGQMNFSKRGLEDSAANVSRLRAFAAKPTGDADAVGPDHPVVARFVAELADDLNVSGALAVVFAFVKDGGAAHDGETLGVLRCFDAVLGVIFPAAGVADAGDVAERCRLLDTARAAKDWAESDRIRDALQADGYEVKTTADGTVATRRLA